MKYLQEHVTEILEAVRNSRDRLAKSGGSWETVAWTRCMADALTLVEALRVCLYQEIDGLGGGLDTCVGVVRRSDDAATRLRWGVLVRAARTASEPVST